MNFLSNWYIFTTTFAMDIGIFESIFESDVICVCFDLSNCMQLLILISRPLGHAMVMHEGGSFVAFRGVKATILLYAMFRSLEGEENRGE